METDQTEDRRLVGEFLEHRDERSFRDLYRRHTGPLYLLARRLLGPSADRADEALQETWLLAARNLGGFRWDSSLRTWLCGIVVNRCRELQRGEARRSAGAFDPSATAPDEWTPAPDGARRIDLERAIATLPSGSREVLVLHDIEGRTHEEIAGLLGISDGTSKSQLHKARRALRDFLSGGGRVDARPT